jgi:hypothetical protein
MIFATGLRPRRITISSPSAARAIRRELPAPPSPLPPAPEPHPAPPRYDPWRGRLYVVRADVAQLVEHHSRKVGVRGSSPRVGFGQRLKVGHKIGGTREAVSQLQAVERIDAPRSLAIKCSADRAQLDTVSYPLPIGVGCQRWSVQPSRQC